MSIWISGTQEDQKCKGIGCPECRYHALSTETFACEIDNGMEGFNRLIDLWSLVDEKKAATLDLYISEGWSYHEEDINIRYYSLQLCKTIAEFLEGLEISLQENIMDERGHIADDKADWILKRSVKIVDMYSIGEKRVFTLFNNFGLYLWPLKTLINKAIELGRRIEFY